MPSLGEHQRAMLDLVKGRAAPPCDPYAVSLVGSPKLALLQDVVVFWRMIAVEGVCASLAELLKLRGVLDETVAKFCHAVNVSPYGERAGEQFLDWMAGDPDPLVGAMAQFERAAKRLRAGDDGDFVVEWDRNPEAVFVSLATGGALPEAEAGVTYRLYLSRALEGQARCERIVVDKDS